MSLGINLSVSRGMLKTTYHPLLHWIVYAIFSVHQPKNLVLEQLWAWPESYVVIRLLQSLHPQMTTCSVSPVMMKHSGAVIPSLVCDLTLAKYLARASELLPPAPHISRILLSNFWINSTLLWPRLIPESSKTKWTIDLCIWDRMEMGHFQS